MEITTNPLIPRKVDEIVDDGDAVAAVALNELYSAGVAWITSLACSPWDC